MYNIHMIKKAMRFYMMLPGGGDDDDDNDHGHGDGDGDYDDGVIDCFLVGLD